MAGSAGWRVSSQSPPAKTGRAVPGMQSRSIRSICRSVWARIDSVSAVTAVRPVVGVGNLLVEDGEVARRLEVVAERLDRPVDDVAVAVGRLHLAEPVEHEPLRPVAGCPVLVRVDEPEQVAQRARVAGGDEELGRALADVAHAPGGAAVLLEPVRRRAVDHRVVEVPAQHVVEAREVVRAVRWRRPGPRRRPSPTRSASRLAPGRRRGPAAGCAAASAAQAVASSAAASASRMLPVSTSEKCVTGFVCTTTYAAPRSAPSS